MTFEILDNNMTILIPKDKLNSRNIKRITQNDIVQVKNELKKGYDGIDGLTWNRRYREYMNQISTGTLIDIAIIKNKLERLRKSKDLSFGERKMISLCNLIIENAMRDYD